MRKRFKGFTLVECLVALAVLGMASLTMAQIYSNVARRNKTNNLVNTSLSNQMAYVEKYSKETLDTVPIYFGGSTAADANYSSADRKPPHISHPSSEDRYPSDSLYPSIKIESTYEIKDKPTGGTAKNSYSYPADIYVLKSRNSKDESLDKTKAEMQSAASGQVGPDSEYVYYDVVDSGNTGGYGEADYNLRYKYILGHNN